MCHKSCIEFGRTHLSYEDVAGKNVIEVGSYNVNGSLRSIIKKLNPYKYIGVDISEGEGVDEICDITNLISHYGKESFDLVICTEVMEHVRHWRKAIFNLKHILKPTGVIILTTRSYGFHFHGHPFDYWRYELDDIRVIFSDLLIDIIEKDNSRPGVFVKASKPIYFTEKDLEHYDLYSIIIEKRCRNISDFRINLVKIKEFVRVFFSHLLPTFVKSYIRKIHK
ncbi:class I SAM-dependent methyltransferase [Candidatus Neomarinimicrobiota bacterium]